LSPAVRTTALPMNTEKENTTAENKIVVYQVFTRLFGNKKYQ
jgi:hypothetical protein